ncbi:MAG: Asp-tRNA(Asn)/Glu-tRNA(Gln) amidotransferase subunit GatB [Gammaproteobacteria bacterium]|nr:Asp-tRNA(Asn)/Glu-tRNA(Gln) amidotransferase subunit GatB [Gammaproteobacteria bacterium]MDA8010720.1 Asp-tRNA(Asn)/Glu-tRNA(Gln) amidotransferase subunit GatB [Gammaproteobacteria bacterium]MDA8021546.1 Asp-tRNA(Asn)/Glu-tRNA(Gln) amidotransferase subunit GatB [Gammaproteobacteria bacterium]
MNAAKWEAVIGLEVHVQLQTAGKIFAPAANAYGADANTQACALSVALPGTLPVMNREAARLAVRFGLAIGAKINRRSLFARKHYFYPDLPKGYQISQYEHPVVGAGHLEIAEEDDDNNGGGVKRIGITRAHLEEDAGKSLHEDFDGMSGIDLNRAGAPLLEIVSEPDLRSPAEAAAYLRALHALVKYLGVSDGNMQEGSFRCDANVSLRRAGASELGTRAEIKNLNSFRFVEKAIAHEIARQTEILESGGAVAQETRLYDADLDQTRPMRSKEDAHDYRYFPDPDLPPLVLDEEFIEAARADLPELPGARKLRFERDFQLPARDAAKLAFDRGFADYFETATAAGADAKTAANWMLGELSAALNRDGLRIEESPLGGAQLAEILARIADRSISGKSAKEVFQAVWRGEGGVDEIINARGLKQITDDSEIENVVARVVAEHPEQAAQYRAGKQKVFGFFVGRVMQASGGKAEPARVNEMLRRALDSE